jgi:Asp/Glu/hydantoin racemase
MRVYAVTPIHVGPAELARRQDRYERLAPGLRIELHDLPASAPAALETAAQVRESEECVIAAVHAADLGGYDAVLPDCMLDPGIDQLSAGLSIPVFGLLRLSAGALSALGRPFGAVARTQPIADELAARLRSDGLDHGFSGCAVLGVSVQAIADDRAWTAALTRTVDQLAATGVSAVINACSAVDIDREQPLAAAVIDPTATALTLLQAMLGSPALPVGAGR